MGCSLKCHQFIEYLNSPSAMMTLRDEQTIRSENVQYLSDSSILILEPLDNSQHYKSYVLTDETSFSNL